MLSHPHHHYHLNPYPFANLRKIDFAQVRLFAYSVIITSIIIIIAIIIIIVIIVITWTIEIISNSFKQ